MQDRDLVRVLLKLGSNVNAADMYGKTPLHYAEMNDQYELLVQYGADENTKDKYGHTPRDLKQLRESVTINEDNAKKLPIGKKTLYTSRDIAQVLNTNHVTELTKRKLVETIRIYSQSPRPQESSEEAIWKIWTENEFIRLNRRLSQLKPLIQHFIERLADGIKEKDWRFECQPILVGSADEETKAVISADFDFNFKLIKFSQLCDPFPHPLGPKGYFQLRRKPNEDTKSRSDEKFDCFFNLDQCLLTNEVNSRFQIILEEVLSDPNFWQDEHLFEWNLTDKYKSKSEKPAGLCKTLRLRMIHPIEDGEGGFLFVNISIDIVACVHVEDWWPEDPLPVGISPAVKANGSTFVFDRPRFDPSKPRGAHFLFSETFARISFAPLESRIIKESSPLIKAAYIVCKMILYDHSKTTYQLKTCLLFCMEALNARNGSETRNEDEITPKQLAFWVERIMFCFMEFSRHDVYPCYAGAQNQFALSQGAMNAAAGQFGAEAANRAGLSNAGAPNVSRRSGAVSPRRPAIFNAAAANQASLANAAAQNQSGLAQFGADTENAQNFAAAQNQMGLAGYQGELQRALEQAQLRAQAGQFNAGADNQMSQFNAGQADNAANRALQAARHARRPRQRLWRRHARRSRHAGRARRPAARDRAGLCDGAAAQLQAIGPAQRHDALRHPRRPGGERQQQRHDRRGRARSTQTQSPSLFNQLLAAGQLAASFIP